MIRRLYRLLQSSGIRRVNELILKVQRERITAIVEQLLSEKSSMEQFKQWAQKARLKVMENSELPETSSMMIPACITRTTHKVWRMAHVMRVLEAEKRVNRYFGK